MKNTMAMIVDVVAGLKDVLLSVIGLGVLVHLIFVGGFFGMDIIGNLFSLVNLFATSGFAGFISLLVILGLLNSK